MISTTNFGISWLSRLKPEGLQIMERRSQEDLGFLFDARVPRGLEGCGDDHGSTYVDGSWWIIIFRFCWPTSCQWDDYLDDYPVMQWEWTKRISLADPSASGSSYGKPHQHGLTFLSWHTKLYEPTPDFLFLFDGTEIMELCRDLVWWHWWPMRSAWRPQVGPTIPVERRFRGWCPTWEAHVVMAAISRLGGSPYHMWVVWQLSSQFSWCVFVQQDLLSLTSLW